jgi:hypothetical protein
MVFRMGERTCPDTPNRKNPDIVPKGNIPTKLHNRKCPDSKKRLSGYFLLGNRKCPDTFIDNRKYPDSKKHCRDISCWAIGNVPTAYLLSGHFLLPNRKYPDRVDSKVAWPGS